MLIYLGFSTVVVFLAALVLLSTGSTSTPAIAHLVFAVGIVPLIFAAISHFVPVLTRGRGAPRSLRLLPLLLQFSGAFVFLAFVGEAADSTLQAAAAATLLLALIFTGWLLFRAGATLGRPHPGWRWYLLATVCLALAVALVPAMSYWPELRRPLRLLHLHLNTLGFIGLTALGTLPVLLPTVLRDPDARAAEQLRRQLPLAAVGVLAVAVGAAGWLPLAIAGALMLLAVTANTGLAWLRRHAWRTLMNDGAAAALFAALVGFALTLGFGIAHALTILDGRDAIAAFMVAFLLPLITGALSQLLPVWYRPGRRTAARDRMHAALRDGALLRSLLFVVGGVLLAFGVDDGAWLAVVAMLSFVIALSRSLLAARDERTEP